jgi:hypothetical protein
MTHLAEELFLNALLTLKVENSFICLVGTRILTMSMMEWKLVLPLKALIRNNNNNNNNNNAQADEII